MPPQQEDDGMATLSSAWGGVHSEAALSCQLWVPNSTISTALESRTDEQVNAPHLLTAREWVRAGDGCAEPEDKCIAQWALLTGRGRCDSVGVWAELSQIDGTGKGCSALGSCSTKLSRIHRSQASGSQVCATTGGREQLAPPKYLPHLLLAKNASEDLRGIMPEPRKTIWPNLLQNNCWRPSWKVLSSSICANTSGAWAPTHTSTHTGQGEMVVHLSLVSLKLLASTDTWKAGGKMGQDPSSFCGEETSSKSTKIPEKGSTCAAIRAVFSGFRGWLTGTERNNQCAAPYTCHTEKAKHRC